MTTRYRVLPATAEAVAPLAALDSLYRCHFEDLCRFAREQIGLEDNAQDVVQDIFLNLLQRFSKRTFPKTLNAGYLYQAVRNKASHVQNRERTESRWRNEMQADERRSDPNPEDERRAQALATTVNNRIAALPTRCKQVFDLVYGKAMSHAQVAEEMAISVKTVEAQLQRGRQRLREQLAQYVEDAW